MGGVSMHKGACAVSDGLIIGSETVDTSVDYLAVAHDKPVLPWQAEGDALAAYLEFFRTLMEAEVS